MAHEQYATIREQGRSAVQNIKSLALLWLAGACLRVTVLAIPPVIPFLHAELHMSETQIGALSSLPTLLFAIAAIPGSLLIARFGAVATLLVGLLVTAAASAARGAALDASFLYATTTLMGAGVSIMQPALPPLVRAWFPRRIGFATAVYTNGLLVGETVVVASTIPLLLPLLGGSWRLAIASWALPVIATAILVVVVRPRTVVAESIEDAPPRASRSWWPDWKSPLIWRLALLLASVNTIYFATNAFLPDYAVSLGRPDLISGALTALNLGQLPASILMLAVAGPLVRRPAAYVATGALSLIGLIGMLVSNGIGIVFWSAVLGFANAVTLILALALPSLLSAPDDVHRTSAGMFTISYSCAMAASVICGWLWDATRMPVAAFVPIGLSTLVIIALASSIGRDAARSKHS
jgi:MFS transporter, CP family, cyanate transporter